MIKDYLKSWLPWRWVILIIFMLLMGMPILMLGVFTWGSAVGMIGLFLLLILIDLTGGIGRRGPWAPPEPPDYQKLYFEYRSKGRAYEELNKELKSKVRDYLKEPSCDGRIVRKELRAELENLVK